LAAPGIEAANAFDLTQGRRMAADEQQKMLDALRWEKADFGAMRALPWSAPM
jgi:hypothetical protein